MFDHVTVDQPFTQIIGDELHRNNPGQRTSFSYIPRGNWKRHYEPEFRR
jgi:hypothetical protein